MAYWLGNGVDRWYNIYLETRLLGRQSIDQPRFQARRLTVYSRVNWKNSVHGLWRLNSWFLTKTDRKKCKNTHNILLDGCYLLFEQYLLENTSVYILKPYQETSESLEESLWGGKLVNPLNPKIKIFILICCPYSFPTEVVGRGW